MSIKLILNNLKLDANLMTNVAFIWKERNLIIFIVSKPIKSK